MLARKQDLHLGRAGLGWAEGWAVGGGAGKIRQVLVKLVRKGQALPRAGAEECVWKRCCPGRRARTTGVGDQGEEVG